MSRQLSEAELSAILIAIAGFPQGISVRGLLEELHSPPAKRSLQYRLKFLVDAGRLLPQGNGPARRYVVPSPNSESRVFESGSQIPQQSADNFPQFSAGNLDLSKAAQETRSMVTRPLLQRTPVGYQRDFLRDYQPNQTAWIPTELRRELAELGKVGMVNVPAGTYLRQVMDRLLIDLSWNSSRLEGNTYSLLETHRLLEQGEVAVGKAAHEAQMLLNHKAAIEMLADQAGELGFNRYTLCNLHAALADNLLAEPSAGGRVRERPVGISGSVFHPLEGPQVVASFFDEFLRKAQAIADPFEQAFFAMVQLPYLQPFEDVNKRVSRLAANIPLVRHNLCPLSFVDVPQDDYIHALLGVYELNRVDYMREVFVWAYRRSAARYSAVCQSLGEPDPFRLRFRQKMKEHVHRVVVKGMDKQQAATYLAQVAVQEIEKPDRARFVEVVETELISLHEGNIARYRLLPEVFRRWMEGWR